MRTVERRCCLLEDQPDICTIPRIEEVYVWIGMAEDSDGERNKENEEPRKSPN